MEPLAVFISYAHADSFDFAHDLSEALRKKGKTVWIDVKSIEPGSAFKKVDIPEGIVGSIAVVTIISPASEQSEPCKEERELAKAHGKKVIPLLYIKPEGGKEFEHDWIDFSKPEYFASGLERLLEAIDTDLAWKKIHTVIDIRSKQWGEAERKNDSFLMNGTELREAENKRREISEHVKPQLTDLQLEFLRASRVEENQRRGRLRILVFSLRVIAIIAIIAVILATVFAGQVAVSAITAAIANARAKAEATRAQGQTNANATAQVRASQQTNIAISRKLAGQASSLIRDNYDLGLLLSVEANNIGNTVDSQRSLFEAVQSNPNLAAHLLKSDQAVTTLSFSPDAHMIGIVYEDGTVALWNILSRSYLPLPSVKGKEIFFSPDNKLMAIAGLDSGVVLWNIDSVRIEQSIPDIQPQSVALTMKGNSYFLVSSDINGDIDVLDLKNNSRVAHYHAADRSQITFNRDGTIAISLKMRDAVSSYEYFRWDVLTGKQIGAPLPITVSTQIATSLAFSQDGSIFFTGGCSGGFGHEAPCTGGGIEMWDSGTGTLVKNFYGHHNLVDSLAFDPKQKILASASGDNTTSDPPTIILWNTETGEKTKTLLGHTGQITSMDFSPDGEYLVSADKYGNIMLWDMAKSSIVANKGEISDVVFRTDGKQLATVSCTFVIGYCETILWDFPSLQQEGISLLSENAGQSIVAIRNDSAIAADYRDGEIMLWNLKTRDNIFQLPGDTSIFNAAFTPDGKNLLIVSKDNTVSLWDTSNNKFTSTQSLSLEESHFNVASKPIFDLQANMAALIGDSSVIVVNFSNRNIVYLPTSGMRYVDKMAFNSDSSLLAISYSPGMENTNYQTILWDTKSGKQAMGPFADQVQSVFSGDGKYLASVDRTNGIVVRDVASGNIVKNIPQKAPDTITQLLYGNNDKWLIATDGNLIYLWDVETGQSIGELSTGGDIKDIVFSPDGVTLAVAGCFEPTNRCSNGEVTFWNLNPDAWKQRACDIVGRNLTQAEWTEYIPDRPYEATCAQYPAGK